MFFYLHQYTDNILKWWKSLNKGLLIVVFSLIITGIIFVFSASPFVALRIGTSPFYFINNHLFFVLIGIITIFVISTFNSKRLFQFILLGFIVSLICLILILVIGQEIKGAKRWLYLFGFSIQPSEFMKVFFVLIFAYVFEYMRIKSFNVVTIYLTLLIIYILVISILLMQPDVGMSALISLSFYVMLFVSGISYYFIFAITMVFLVAIFIMYITFPHVAYRVNSFFVEQKSYQVSKALESISSGKIFGKGAGQGMVKQYLPDVHADFIFSSIAEELGLLFALLVIGLYFYMALIILKHIQFKQTKNHYILALYGLLSIIIFQCFIHVGSNISLIPAKGMTLPFISYGGSSFLSTSILIGIILNITRKKETLLNTVNKEQEK